MIRHSIRTDTPGRLGRPISPPTKAMPGSRTAHGDPRWPRIAAALEALSSNGRHAVRIIDADCGCGTLLIEAARYARHLGFTSIEGCGIDGSPALIGRARAAAGRVSDPASGLSFELADLVAALAQEAEFPADIVLWHGSHDERQTGLRAALAAAGDVVIADPPHDAANPA